MHDSDLYNASSSQLLAGPSGPRPALSVFRAFSIVIASGAGFGAAGMGIGYALGILAPSYYRGVFSNGNDPAFDPVQVGIGLGFSQGAICGMLVGMIVILAVAISGRRGSSSTEQRRK